MRSLGRQPCMFSDFCLCLLSWATRETTGDSSVEKIAPDWSHAFKQFLLVQTLTWVVRRCLLLLLFVTPPKRHLLSKVCQSASMVDWKTIFPTADEACDNCSAPRSRSQRRRNFLRGETERVGSGGEMKAVWWRKGRWKQEKDRKALSSCSRFFFFFFPSTLSVFTHYLREHICKTCTLLARCFKLQFGLNRKILSNSSTFV